MISLDPDTGAHDPEVLRGVARAHEAFAGVYCAVLVEGVVSAGDSVKVVSAPFVVDKTEPADLPVWKQPWLLDIARSAIVPLAFVAIALIAVFGMIRPAIKAAAPVPLPEKTETVDEVVDDAELLPGAEGMPKLEAPIHNEKLDRARVLARDNPVAVANIVRDWMEGQTA